MRTLPLMLLLAACPATAPSTPPVDPAPPAEDPPTPDVVDPEAAPAPEAADAGADPTPIPDAPPNPQAVPVALVGYGLRYELTPPFQIARVGDMLGGDSDDALFVSWWDITAPGAGSRGDHGLYNVAIVPGTSPAADATVQPATITQKGHTVYVLRLGEGGTEVRLPHGHNTLGGAGVVKPGPTEAGWSLQWGETTAPWPAETMVHSADPASGKPVAFEDRPRQPWGPWPR